MCVQSLANPTFLRSGTITEECASCYCVEEFNSCYEMAPLCLVATTVMPLVTAFFYRHAVKKCNLHVADIA